MALQHLTLSRAAWLAICTAVLALGGTVAATQEPNQPQGSSEGVISLGTMAPVHFDLSPPLTQIPDQPPAMQRVRIEEIDVRGNIPGPQDIDHQVQQDVDAAGEIPAAAVGFNAFDNTSAAFGPTPPDPVGDVGPNHYVAMANSRYAVYNKAGGLVFGPININTLWAGFGGPCQVENAGDPVVIHDQLADRWLLMQFTASGPNFFLCVAISQTPNPAGAFFRYAISTGTRFPDYPKVGMWPNAFVFTTREFSGPFVGVGVYGMNRAQALAGNPAAQIVGFLATPGATPYRVGDGLLPADLDGFRLPPSTNPAFLVGLQDNGGGYGAPIDAINIWQLNLNFGGVSTLALTSTVATAAFDSIFPCAPGSRDCIPQPGTAQRVDHQGYRQRLLHRAAYRNHGTHQSIVSNSSVEAAANMSGVRWYEVRSPQAAPVIFQQGTYAPGTVDGIHRWFGSIAQDQNGNMGLGYSASSAAVFPGIRYTGRLATDALNTMPQGEGTFQAGGGSQTGSARWGDYTSMNVDPVDDCTLWYVNQYNPATTATGWRLRVGAFEFPSCAPRATIVSLWPVGTVNPGGTARFWALVRNDGTRPMTAESRVWFYQNVTNTWVGSVALTGLAPGASAWYFVDYVVPANAAPGTRSYWAQVWKNSTYPQSPFTGPQNFTIAAIQRAVIDALWPVTGAYPGGVVRLWALVRHTGNQTLSGDARVAFWSSITGTDVGTTSIVGLAPGQSRWYVLNWAIPAGASPDGIRNYWAQARIASYLSPWVGPMNFPMGFNFQFTSNIAGWTAQRGTWSHSSGAFLFTAGLANNGSSVSHPANLRYLDYQVRTWRNGCNTCANRIMVRGTPAPLNATGQWNANFFFQYSRDGMFSVYRTVAGVTTAIQNWTNTPAVVQGSAWNTLRVVSYEDTFLYYINGILVWAGTDASLPAAGLLGIGEFNDGSAGNAFWVDYAIGIPTGTTTEGAEAAAGPMPTDRVSDAQQRLNVEANRQPSGDVDSSR